MLSARCFFPRSRGAPTGRHPRAATTPFIIGKHAQPRPSSPGRNAWHVLPLHVHGERKKDERQRHHQHRTSHRGRAAQAVPAPLFRCGGGRLGGSKRQRHGGRHGLAPCHGARGEIDRSCSCPGRPGGATRPAAGRWSKPCVRASREIARAALSLQRCAASPSLPGRQGSSPDRDRIGGSLSGAAAVRAATPTRRGRVRVAAGFPQLDRIARPARGLGGVRAAAARWNIVPSVRRITVVRWGRAW